MFKRVFNCARTVCTIDINQLIPIWGLRSNGTKTYAKGRNYCFKTPKLSRHSMLENRLLQYHFVRAILPEAQL